MNINEAIEQLKYYQSKPYVPTVKKVCDIALEAIEALQQENEQLKEQINTAKIGWDTYKTYSEQLEAKLDEWKYEAKCHMDEVIAREKQIEQLQTQAVRMWEALRKAKEVLYNLRMDDYPGFSAICEALTAIDKAIGG